MQTLNVDDVICNLKTSGFSYEEIAEYLTFEGITIDVDTIKETYKKIQFAKVEKTPQKKMANKNIQIPEEELYTLREQGLSYKRISEHFKKNGIKVGSSAIRKRCKIIYKKKENKNQKQQNIQ